VKSLAKYGLGSLLLCVLASGGAVLYADSRKSAPDADGRVSEMQKEVESDLRHVHRLQDIARRQNDIIRLTCVNDRFIELKGAANVFDEHRHAFYGAPDAVALSSLSEDVSAAHKIRGQADACVGEPELAGESTNGFDHQLFPDDPTMSISFTPIEPPAYASPFN
jgi:hypothetical protein